MYSNVDSFMILLEQGLTMVFKTFLLIAVVLWFGPLYGIPFFILFFCCFRIILYRKYGLISLNPFELCLISTSNKNRYNVVSINIFENFDAEKIKEVLISKLIMNHKKLHSRLVYRFFNFYWKEVSIEDAIAKIKIVKEEIEESKFNDYVEQELYNYFDILKEIPYEIKLIPFSDKKRGALLLKLDHIITDGLGIISMVCCLDDNYSPDIFPQVMKNVSLNKVNPFLYNLTLLLTFPYYGTLCFFIMFFTNSGFNSFRDHSNKNAKGKINFEFGKSLDLTKFQIIRKKKNMTFNEALMLIFSNASFNTLNKNTKNLKIMIPICRKEIPENAKKIKLTNETNNIFTRIKLLNNEEMQKDEEINQFKTTLRKEVSNYLLNDSYLLWPKITGRFLSFSAIGMFADFYFRNIDIAISNVPGPKRKISYNGCVVEKMYGLATPGRGITYCPVVSYNNQLIMNIAMQDSINVDSKKFMECLYESYDRFINSN